MIATVTFEMALMAKKALDLNGKLLDGHNISVDKEFMGFTTLASPSDSRVAYV